VRDSGFAALTQRVSNAPPATVARVRAEKRRYLCIEVMLGKILCYAVDGGKGADIVAALVSSAG
jgi:hypothetical protein